MDLFANVINDEAIENMSDEDATTVLNILTEAGY